MHDKTSAFRWLERTTRSLEHGHLPGMNACLVEWVRQSAAPGSSPSANPGKGLQADPAYQGRGRESSESEWVWSSGVGRIVVQLFSQQKLALLQASRKQNKGQDSPRTGCS